MSRYAFASDIHAGLGSNDASLRKLQTTAVKRAATYIEDQGVEMLVFNGDTTDHIGNALSSGTSREIAHEMLRPFVSMIQQGRERMHAVFLSGNTDWPIADPRAETQQLFFEYTGLDKHAVTIPAGGLLHAIEAEHVTAQITHGHAMKPEAWGHTGPMTEELYRRLWKLLKKPSQEFLDAISSVSGAHRRDYLKAAALGFVVRQLPSAARTFASDTLKGKLNHQYERHYANTLALLARQKRRRIIGIMGHTHVAGIREHDGVTIINTGTTGAKPNPLQRTSDPKGHITLLDTTRGTYDLVQTFDAAHPDAKPKSIGTGSLHSSRFS